MKTRFWMLRLATSIAMLALLGGCASMPKEPQLTPEQERLNVESFDFVWSTVNDRYWDPEFGGVDWPAVRDELRPKMERASTASASRSILRDMIERLGRSHYAIFPPEVYEDVGRASDALPDGYPGIDLRVIDGLALVTAVDRGSPADEAGVRTGWEILRVGDVDVRARLERLSQTLEDDARKPMRLAYAIIPELIGNVGDSVHIAFLDGDDETVDVDLDLIEMRGRKSPLGNLGEARVWIDVKTLNENVGYIAFSAFVNPGYVMKTFNDAMRSFRQADGVIMDLRGNSGGLGAMAMGMAGWFLEEDRTLGTLRLRDRDLKMIVQARPKPFIGPLAILVDGLSGSASEFLSGGLQEIGRACVVGSRTKGEALPGQFTTLPNGDVFMYAVANFVSADGHELEGVGVIPDIEANLTRAALLDGRDPAVDAALHWIREQGSRNRVSERPFSTTEVTTQ